MVIRYFKNIIKGNDRDAFINKVKLISKKFGFNPNWLLLVINSETGGTFSASIQNSTSGATGLIQFMPDTALSLGTSVAELAQMTRLKQLDYVYAYFKSFIKRGFKIKSYEDLYLLTFYPYALNKADKYIFGSEVSKTRAAIIKQQNPFDYNNDGYISKAEFKKWIYKSKVQDTIPKSQIKIATASNNDFLFITFFGIGVLTYVTHKVLS